MLDLGFVSAIMADKSFEEVIDFASDNKFKCVEIMCWPVGKAERRYAGVTHIDVDKLDNQKINHIKHYLVTNNVYISGLGYYPNPLEDSRNTEKYIEHIKSVIRAANKLDIPVVNTFIGRDHTKSLEDNFKLFKDRWPAIVKVAEEENVNIGIENCPMLFTKDEWPGGKNMAFSPAIWDMMFKAIPSRVFGLNYDPSHLIWMHMDEIKPIYQYHKRFHHVHLKDVKIHKDRLDRVGILAHPLEYHSPKLPGLGDVRWGDFFAALTSVGYRGPVCIEVEDRAFEKTEKDIETSILVSRNFLSQFLVL